MMEKNETIAKLMEKAVMKSFEKPDEVREFPRGRVELVKI